MNRATSRKPRPAQFNLLARILHWLMAAGVLAMLFMGVTMMSSLTLRPALLNFHQSLGLALLVLVIIRLANRLASGAPPLPSSVSPVQKLIARLSHWLLYGLLVAIPVVGWAMRSAGGWPIRLAEGVLLPPIAPVNSTLYAVLRDAHGILGWSLFVLVLIHVAAALMHAWVLRDGVFSTMTTGAGKHKT